jgi:hypothetical protein
MGRYMSEVNPKDIVRSLIIENMRDHLKEIFEKKHLYQNIEIKLDKIKDYISTCVNKKYAKRFTGYTQENANNDLRKDLTTLLDDYIKSVWAFTTKNNDDDSIITYPPLMSDGDILPFILPTVNILCKCTEEFPMPHNPGYGDIQGGFPSLILSRQYSSPIIQLFFITYRCQKCKGEPIAFILKRSNLKLQLVGRSKLDIIKIPKYLPKEESGYFRDAIIANNTGNNLAAIFYLRVFIEQYLRRVLNKFEKASGDDLAERYWALLSDDFPKDKYKSFGKIYEDLSMRIHEAKEDYAIYEESKINIEKHFDLLQHFPLKTIS